MIEIINCTREEDALNGLADDAVKTDPIPIVGVGVVDVKGKAIWTRDQKDFAGVCQVVRVVLNMQIAQVVA